MAHGKVSLALVSPFLCALEHLLAWWFDASLERMGGDSTDGSRVSWSNEEPNQFTIYLNGPACRYRVAAECHELGHLARLRAGHFKHADAILWWDYRVYSILDPLVQREEWEAWLWARKVLCALGLWDSSMREFAHRYLESYKVTRRLPL